VRVVLAAVVLWSVGWWVTPAEAHPVAGAPASSDWRVDVQGISPHADGVSLRAIDAGVRLELTVSGPATVIVSGYQNEPYLRIGPDGVFENRRSPATYLNSSMTGAPVPDDADPEREPDWQRTDTARVARWHDHRTHWMGPDPPEEVRRDPGSEHVMIERWVIPVTIDGVASEATGALTWVPPPNPWPWIVVAAGSMAALAVAGGTRRWVPAAVAATAALLVIAVLDATDGWIAVPDAVAARLAGLVPVAVGAGLLVAGLVAVRRRRPATAFVLLGGGGGGLGLVIGWVDHGYLFDSQIPTALGPTAARAVVAGALGLGLGLGLLALDRALAAHRTSPTAAHRPGTPRRGWARRRAPCGRCRARPAGGPAHGPPGGRRRPRST
jgi:hypothetical protein